MKKLMKKCAVLFSGGKDSCLALHMAKEKYEICCLLSIIPDNFDSFMFHKPYDNLLKKQAEMLGIELKIKKSKGLENEEIEDLRELLTLAKGQAEVIAVGGIASNYQGERIKKICDELGFEFYAPLWNVKGEEIWNKLFQEDFKVILTKISSEGIPKEFLGKIMDRRLFNELKRLGDKYKFRIDFEGGEAESAVLYMPEFKKEIKIKYEIKSEGKHRHWIEIV
jgi:ABC transporter with metal-binding/Fe-S-binding domain ATP-binding protein